MPLEVAERPRGEGPKKKREPLVPIPADAPKMPDFKDMKAKIDGLHEQIKGYKQEITDLRAKAEDRKKAEDDPRQQLIKDKDALHKQRAALSKELGDLRLTRNDMQKQVNEIRQAARDQERDIRAMNKELGDLMTVEQIDAKIKKLEFEHQSGSSATIKGERTIMKQIRMLEASREKAAQMNQKADTVIGQRSQEDKLFDDVKKTQKTIDDKSNEYADVLKKLDEKQNELNAFTGNDTVKKEREERDAISAKITAAYGKMDTVRAEFDKKKAAYEEWKVDYDKKCQEVREKKRKEREEEDRKYQEKMREKELQLAALHRLNPHEEEIANAEALIGYLKAKIAFQQRDEKKTEAKNTSSAHFDPSATAMKGMTVLKKEEDDDWLFGSKKNKKAAAPKPKPKEKPAEPVAPKAKSIAHNSEKLAAFESIGVKVPHNTLEVKDVIEELKKKKAHWETFKKTEKQAMEEEKAEREQKEAAEAAAAAAKKAEEEADEE